MAAGEIDATPTPSRFEGAARFLAELETVRRTMPMTIEFTAHDRPRSLASLTRRGVLRLMSPLVSWLGRRQEREIWRNLKRLLERGDVV